jgi:hypothetical protein
VSVRSNEDYLLNQTKGIRPQARDNQDVYYDQK